MKPYEPAIVFALIVGTVVLAIVALTLFYRMLSWWDGPGAQPNRIAIRGVLNEKTLVTIHLNNGVTYENVRCVGFTDNQDPKRVFPWELHGMVIVEHADKRRSIFPAKLIRLIEVPVT